MKELPLDRLATTTARGARIYLYPADVRGVWGQRRLAVSGALMLIFLGLPWVKVGGHPAVLLDILHGRFAIFGLTFWAHDAPLIFFLAVGAIISIALVTAIWGRAWCGWACPQTVFVEQVFRRIERAIEGNALERKQLDEASWSAEKFFKKGLKWLVFSTVALIISHSFLAYFIGTAPLGKMMATSPAEHRSVFLAMLGMTALVLFDFAWFREQFCTIVCPYGRFQSVLMDRDSTVVQYDARRGEPRRAEKADAGTPHGDCVNCYRCVQVCPTGIDIRRGVQLECVACTACIDACDEVMRRLHKPAGLIRYGSQTLAETTQPAPPWHRRTRAWVYFAVLATCLSSLGLTISRRHAVEATVIRATGAPYQELPEGIVNHFKVDVQNQTFADQSVRFSLAPESQAAGLTLVMSNHRDLLPAGESERADAFIRFPRSVLTHGHARVPLRLEILATAEHPAFSYTQEVSLVGPLR